MEDKEKAKIIVDIIRRQVDGATATYIRTEADLAKAEMGSQLWEKEHKDEMGCFDHNPYNVEVEREQVDRALKERRAKEEVFAYAMDVFLDKIESI